MYRNKTISCRVDADLKESIDTILNEINKEIINEPKKNYRYAFEFLKEYYINNPNYSDILLEVELRHKIKRLKEEKKLIDYQLDEAEKELKETIERINQPGTNNQEVLLTPNLTKAMGILKNNCEQQNITEFRNIPQEMITAIANTCKVRKSDFITLAKKEF